MLCILSHPKFCERIKYPCRKSLLKVLRQKKKMMVTSIFPFSNNVFSLSKNNFISCPTSAGAVDLEQSRILLFGKELVVNS